MQVSQFTWAVPVQQQHWSLTHVGSTVSHSHQVSPCVEAACSLQVVEHEHKQDGGLISAPRTESSAACCQHAATRCQHQQCRTSSLALLDLTPCRFKGRPHWGKNYDRTFLHPRCPIVPLYPKFGTLLDLANQYDPAGMFKTQLFDRMVAQDSIKPFPQCT